MTHPELVVELEVRIAEPIDARATPGGHRRLHPCSSARSSRCSTARPLGVSLEFHQIRAK